jgi:enoyl-CoA hydratase/carnithine racemase
MKSLDKDDKIGCIVLTGGTRAFAGKFDLIS